MKRTFPIILLLISISLIGIILIQISWLRNMVLLRQEQIDQKIADVTQSIAEELSQYKGTPLSPSKSYPELSNDFSLETIRPYSVGSRLTAQEIYEKIRFSFDVAGLEDVPFEFGLTLPHTGEAVAIMQRQTPGFGGAFSDSTNYKPYYQYLISPSGSPTENLVLDEVLIIVVPEVGRLVLKDLQSRIIAAILFTIVIVTAFYLTVHTMLRQKKLSEIRNDFINNMTHEFKTPIATISLAVDALKNEKVMRDPQKLGYFSGIIKEENQRMNRQVETILKSALMDRQEVELNRKPLHVHKIINDVADNFMLRLQEKQGALHTELNAASDLILADEVHISNLVNNLLDNAVKYSKEHVPPRIHLATSSTERKFILRLEDNGIGMTRETVKRIFEKFYRAHTGNIHNVKGFGLGLSYVKTVVEAHDGHIKAESTLGKGSCFTIELPLSK